MLGFDVLITFTERIDQRHMDVSLTFNERSDWRPANVTWITLWTLEER